MATIDDFGSASDPLSAPALGGANGWAAAVRDSLNTKANNSHAHDDYLLPSEVVAGTNVTVDTATTPGKVIVSASGGTGDVTAAQFATAILFSTSPSFRPPAASGQKVEFFCDAEPSAALIGDIWWNTTGAVLA